jgi:hypothetical protein
MEKYCLDCNSIISKKSIRCKSCANKHRWLDKNDPRREKIIKRNKKYKIDNLYEDKDLMHKKYVEEQKSIQEIADELNCSKRTIARWLDAHNIKTRSTSKSLKISKNKKEKPINLNYVCPSCGNKKGYYSNKCSNCYDRNGKNNPNYKGIYEISITVRTWSKKYWRPKILERDNFICKECGETNINLLEAHHINHLSNLIKNKIKTYNNESLDKFELSQKIILDKDIQSIENGITLCKNCHRKKHKK